ncbi:glycerophosphoryl diester phosphodiesterase membrane domain-containing protein [Sandaracinobacter sp. RS1-74]|uniref:glycerophosphoryl diester phosphodiesterase membrane domain-containing protein n=1 Tax=Sandaracinobacteroides sayramensis TaxID=2913411 RepID=UPI001EDBC88F|nr:glycerophosphoryl diester phosphodiesterase membrane domain-containing protein [Sandaracinobacteroides sayramensis]MCG2842521.1 glycerophosphoryl diester phosphodiesterase membrane domain-containing protein [Sandaracinobacteroides sayramensis]
MADAGPGSSDNPLSFGPLWADTLDLVRRHGEILWPLAAAFLFLPQILIAVVTPEQGPNARPDMGPDMALAMLMLAAGLAGLLATLVGQVSVAFLAVHDGTAGLTLGQVIARSARLLLPAMAVVLMQGIAIFVGLLLLIVPGLWLLARFSVALPTVSVGPHDPLEALKESWRLTEGYALKILGALLILTLGMFILYFGILAIGVAVGAIGTIAGGQPETGWSLGRWAFEVIGAAAVAAMGVISICFYSSLLKTLRRLPRHSA